jgi:hypothetical protein
MVTDSNSFKTNHDAAALPAPMKALGIVLEQKISKMSEENLYLKTMEGVAIRD